MTEPIFAADPARLLIASSSGNYFIAAADHQVQDSSGIIIIDIGTFYRTGGGNAGSNSGQHR